MKPTAPPSEAYRRQLDRCAQALAVAQNDAVRGDLAPEATLAQVKLFTDGNLDKRFQKLVDQLELVAEAYDRFEELVERYVRQVPLDAYASGPEDADRFLRWLSRRRITPEQRDVVACQRSRHAIEAAARRNRLGYVRFHDLSSVSESLAAEWGRDEDLRLHLNPIRVWAAFETRALLDDDADIPAEVLFYPVGGEIRTAVLEARGRELVRSLESRGPCRFDEVTSRGDDLGREEIGELCHDLVEMGLAAFG
jgi:hypothetical protein